MAWKRRVEGGVLGVVGFILSPLSWWNDTVVNLPLAVGFGWIVARFHERAFVPAVIVGYWLTNIAGLILLHKGAQKALSKKERPYGRREIVRDLGISAAYTVVILALVWLGILRPVENYFPEK